MRRQRALVLAAALLLVSAFVPVSAKGTTLWRWNSWRPGGFLYQDPYYTACTAAATMIMLNYTALAGTGGNDFIWRPYRTQRSSNPADTRDMTSILAYERNHDTLAASGSGSDANGWRNALNLYGWGPQAVIDPDKRVYEVKAYGSFDGALRAAARAIAKYHKPVGILAWGGRHAQVLSGYSVTGENPATSSDFVVNGFWISDPLRSDRIANQFITRAALLTGGPTYRFRPYNQIDSPYDDPYTPGNQPSATRSRDSAWYGRWVIVAPVRKGGSGKSTAERTN